MATETDETSRKKYGKMKTHNVGFGMLEPIMLLGMYLNKLAV